MKWKDILARRGEHHLHYESCDAEHSVKVVLRSYTAHCVVEANLVSCGRAEIPPRHNTGMSLGADSSTPTALFVGGR